MSPFDELHEKAMDLAEQGESLRRIDPARAKALYSAALKLELEALQVLNTEDKLTRAVFLRSAAALAVGAEDYREVRRLVDLGKRIAPPEIVNELEVLLGSVPPEARSRFNPKHLTNVPAPGDYKPLWQKMMAPGGVFFIPIGAEAFNGWPCPWRGVLTPRPPLRLSRRGGASGLYL